MTTNIILVQLVQLSKILTTTSIMIMVISSHSIFLTNNGVILKFPTSKMSTIQLNSQGLDQDSQLVLVVAKIVDDLLITGIPSEVKNFLTDVNKQFSFGALVSGSGI